MIQRKGQQNIQQQEQRYFTASEVAEFEYCPLVWWYEQYEEAAQEDTEDLFARLVELEHEHDTQAPALPEYQMIEQLLVRRGAFEEGRQQHLEHAEEVAEVEDERVALPDASGMGRRLVLTAAIFAIIAIALILLSLVIR